MKRLERLEYLKTVKRAEIKELLKKARTISVPLEEKEEYDNARTLQAEVEKEISRLEKITDKEYPRYNVLKNLEKHEIFKFFGNDDFVYANRNKKFTVEEKIAIIVHSTNHSLENKFEALRKLSGLSNELKEKIELWIDYKQKTLDAIRAINNNEQIFAICTNLNIPVLCRTLDDSLKLLSWGETRIDIVKIIGNGKISAPVNRVLLTDRREITDVFYTSVDHEYSNLEKEEKLENLKVELKNPFKPFTIINNPVNGAAVIVADIKNSKTQAETEQTKQLNKNSWLQCEIPIYEFPNGWMSGEAAHLKAGCLYTAGCRCLSTIKTIEPTLNQVKYVRYLRKAVKEK